jgi:hypothetical protein
MKLDIILKVTLILSCIVIVVAVVPAVTGAGRVYYSRTQYLLPCNICVAALQRGKLHRSLTLDAFVVHAESDCLDVTHDRYIQQACIAVLGKNAEMLWKDQLNGESVHSSCARTSATSCKENKAKYAVHCDKRKKRGFCHVIPIN